MREPEVGAMADNPVGTGVLRRHEVREIAVALGVLLIVRGIILAIFPHGLGSVDLRSWIEVTNLLLAGENPYTLTDKLNWPPFWMQILYVLGRLTLATSISFELLVKLLLVSVEGAVVVALYLTARRLLGADRPLRTVVVAICANPVALLLSLQHCNFDVFVGLWVLLFFGAVARFSQSGEEKHWLLGTLFLGLAIWTKTVPLCLVPVALFGIRRVSAPARLVGAFLIFAPITIAMSVIYVLTPAGVTEHVLRYRSSPGFFGVSGLLDLLDLHGVTSLTAVLFQVLFLGAIVYAAVRFYRRDTITPSALLGVILLFLMSIPVLGPGYAPQYAYWFLPLLALYYHCATGSARRVLLALHCVMVLTYIVEYALFRTHGQYLRYLIQTDTTQHLSRVLSTNAGQTLVRLPLFGLYIALLAGIGLGLRAPRTRS